MSFFQAEESLKRFKNLKIEQDLVLSNNSYTHFTVKEDATKFDSEDWFNSLQVDEQSNNNFNEENCNANVGM